MCFLKDHFTISCQWDYLWQNGLVWRALVGNQHFGPSALICYVVLEVIANHREMSQQSSYINNFH